LEVLQESECAMTLSDRMRESYNLANCFSDEVAALERRLAESEREVAPSREYEEWSAAREKAAVEAERARVNGWWIYWCASDGDDEKRDNGIRNGTPVPTGGDNG